jgi:uncharacterized membrane protein YbaN (DUF454 family)
MRGFDTTMVARIAMTNPAPQQERSSGPLRWVLIALGVVFTGLAAAGAVLPLLPTTPFLLLALACFARSSPALHRRLLANRIFGPFLTQWQKDRSVTRGTKLKAYAVVIATFSISIILVEAAWQRLLLGAILLILLGFLARLPTTRDGGPPS